MQYRVYPLTQNKLCDIRLKTCKNAVSDDFTSNDIKSVISEFGLIREIFTRGGESLTWHAKHVKIKKYFLLTIRNLC